MTNQIKKQKKAEKRRKQIKDYTKKKNIIANRPTIKRLASKPIYERREDRKGVVTVEQVGTKEFIEKIKTVPSKIGITFPISKKFKSKKIIKK